MRDGTLFAQERKTAQTVRLETIASYREHVAKLTAHVKEITQALEGGCPDQHVLCQLHEWLSHDLCVAQLHLDLLIKFH